MEPSSKYYVHFDRFGGLAFEEMLVFLLSEKARRWCAKHSEAAPAPASSERATAETLLKVRKSYISETASRKTGQNVIHLHNPQTATEAVYLILLLCLHRPE